MERDWDSRAREAPEYYIASARREWRADEFFRSGEINVEDEILPDGNLICRGKEFSQMRVLEIGCGAGRMTRALAAVFHEVHAVDISSEMIALAKRNLSGLRNVVLYKNNGADLFELPSRCYDFAFSFIVFQHIPVFGVIESYVREVYRCLKPGAVFKFQVQGASGIESAGDDTWVGVPVSLADAQALAARCGFQLVASTGEGTQYFWLWFLKPPLKGIRRHIAAAAARMRNAIETLLDWGGKRVAVAFSPESVRAGEPYSVRVPGFAGREIDVRYELTGEKRPDPVTGVVTGWCMLDLCAEARLIAPAEHPTGVVRITGVRSRTNNGRWRRAEGAIRVAPADEPLDR